ncbi:MAG TPA: S-adenosylmethionine decarboxylase [Candidatus Nanoarchaeia archaeon]|nr:S-adenosylmethionine decarboxylase [Candidatus Nanoarchaeia archaeon]
MNRQKNINFTRKTFNHLIIELFEVNLKNKEELLEKIKKFIEELNLTVVKTVEHEFTPHGLTCVFILSSSHLIAHTWPEHNYLHLDLFSCLNRIDESLPNKIVKCFGNNYRVRRINYDSN